MPVSVTHSYHSDSRYGSSYSPSAYSSSYLPPRTPYRSSTYSSYRSTALDDSYSSSRDKSVSTDSAYSSASSKSRDYKSRSLNNADSSYKSSSISSSSLGLSSRRPSATSASTYTSSSSALDVSRYSPANYVPATSRSAATAAAARPPRASGSYTPSTSSLRSSITSSTSLSRYSEQDADRESVSPSKSRTSQDQRGLTGLNNIGNTCFLNSIVQCLSNTKVLLEYILNQDYVNEIRSSAKSALMKRFAELIKNLWQGDKMSIPTYSFKTEVDVFAPRFSGYYQQDAQEFLRYLLEGLHDELNRVTTRPKGLGEIDDDLSDSQKAVETWKRYLRLDNSKVVDTFGGLLKSTLECTHCGHCSTTFEAFWDLSLPIPDSISHPGKILLCHCLDLFTKEEVLDGDEMPTCSKCKTRRKCKKRFLVQKFPEVLVIHLKRFSLGSRARKVESAIDFPIKGLDMSPYSADNPLKSLSYDLYGIVNHNGTCYTGHYTAYCRNPYSSQWHLFNDRSVSSASAESLNKRDAYVLFYEQTSPSSSSSNPSTNL